MNYRKTIQKERIIIAMKDLFHPTAEELCKRIEELFGAVSVATVYRNLKAMVASGEIKKIEAIGRADRFDKSTENHYHLLCNNCGKLFDIDANFMPKLEVVKNDQGFLVDIQNITFSGQCKDCQKNKM